jgi:hypothetical protein
MMPASPGGEEAVSTASGLELRMRLMMGAKFVVPRW